MDKYALAYELLNELNAAARAAIPECHKELSPSWLKHHATIAMNAGSRTGRTTWIARTAHKGDLVVGTFATGYELDDFDTPNDRPDFLIVTSNGRFPESTGLEAVGRSAQELPKYARVFIDLSSPIVSLDYVYFTLMSKVTLDTTFICVG